jgi:succinoglycan biosynthesis protein ExoA
MLPEPFVSIVIPVRNEARALPSLLESLILQDYPRAAFEIIVADGQSTDQTRTVIRDFAARAEVPVILVENPGIRSSAGRNAGVAASRGEFVIFIDGHCHIPSRSLLRDSVTLFQAMRADCLCRPQPLLAPADSWLGSVIAAVRASTLGHGRDSLIYDMTTADYVDPASSGASYRRTVFNAIGGFDERFDACEDVEFNTRVRKAGMVAYTDPRLAVHYQPRSTLHSLLRQMIRYGRGRVRLMRKHPDTIAFSQLAPAIFVAWTLAAIVTCLLPVPLWLRLVLFAPLEFYVVLLATSAFTLARKHSRQFFLPAIAVYSIIHFGLGAGLWIEAFSSIKELVSAKAPSARDSMPECQARQQRG